MKLINWILILVSLAYLWVVFTQLTFSKNNSNSWESQVMPGQLSAVHTQLETNCASCHTAVKGVDDVKCVSCHADNKALLGRQPTAFHANIGNCGSCHIEHRGSDANLRVMNHETLAQIGANLLPVSDQLNNSLLPSDHPLLSEMEAKLNCVSCHGTKDKHFGLFGQNCGSCHASTQWTIPKFQHPSPNSIQCAQCHQAPPSHYMEHFEMISKKIASRTNEQNNGCCNGVIVSQCYSCHKTTVWNDIQGVGFYKHH